MGRMVGVAAARRSELRPERLDLCAELRGFTHVLTNKRGNRPASLTYARD